MMSPGPAEEVGATARSVVNALRANPTALALIVFNLIIITALFFGISSERRDTSEITKLLIAQCVGTKLN
jgi:hypothetical protein